MNTVEIKEKIRKNVLQEIENISVENLEKINNNTHEIKIKIEKIRKREKPVLILTDETMRNYEKMLNGLSTRKEGVELLSSLLKDRNSVEYFAKFLSVSFLKQDNKEYILNKIVEATIGAKLRSLAIKGE
jgi:hypothetical protein